MATRTRSRNQHHVENLDDCRQLLEQMGFTISDEKSEEDDKHAVAMSIQTTPWMGRQLTAGVVRLNKTTGQLTISDRTK